MCIKDNKADHYIGWDSLRTRINNILTSEKCKVNEDKLLGPFSLLLRYLCFKVFKDAETKDLLEANNVTKLELN